MSDEKLILKDYSLPGVDKSVNDLSLLSQTSGAVQCKVTKAMTKVPGGGLIGLSISLEAGEVVKVGKLNKLYKVVKFVKMTDTEGRLIKLKRVDGNIMTETDLNATEVGQIALIVSRRTVTQKLADFKNQHQVK